MPGDKDNCQPQDNLNSNLHAMMSKSHFLGFHFKFPKFVLANCDSPVYHCLDRSQLRENILAIRKLTIGKLFHELIL